ncbi:MAG: patatin-like phospholipase family protein [Anaerolineae bacterium]|nr:patatin-like phospholipase family protein [Anaerolineae bacterium]
MDVILALGGGGAKGNAHIGVLRVLEHEGFTIRAVAGTSAGGMAAAAYAAGHSPHDLQAYMAQVNQGSFYGFHLDGEPALLGVNGIYKALHKLLGEKDFSDLRIPCALTAVDLENSKRVILKQGRVMDALMATIAIPGVFPPKRQDGRLLVDGGLLDPVPVTVVREIAPRRGLPVVAVALTPEMAERSVIKSPGFLMPSPILNQIARLKVAQAFEIFMHSLEIGISAITDLRLEIDKPDIIIRPDVAHIGYLDRVNIDEVIRLGEIAAEAALPELRRIARRRQGFFRRSRKS